MPVQVKPTHSKTPAIELLRHVVVTAGVFTQAMHQQHHAAQLLFLFNRPILHGDVVAVTGDEGG